MLTGVPEITSEKYSQLVDFTIESGGNLIAIALAGTGKTEIAIERIKHAGFKPLYLNMSVMESPELVGLPEKDRDRNVVRYIPPEFMPQDGEEVVLVVDEVDKLKSELQGPLLEIFQFRTINGTKLKIKAIIATGNLPDEGAFSLPISHALTNRCMVVKVTADYHFWQTWAVAKAINPLIVGFLGRDSALFAPVPKKDDPTAYCRPSPRSWTNAAIKLDELAKSKIIKGMKDEDLIELQSRVVSGYTGMEPANKFRVWLTHYRHIAGVVDDLVYKGVVPKENYEIDRKLVFNIACCSTLATMPDKDKPAIRRAAQYVFDYLAKQPSDIQLAAVKSTLQMEWMVRMGFNEIASVKTIFGNINRVLNNQKDSASDEPDEEDGDAEEAA